MIIPTNTRASSYQKRTSSQQGWDLERAGTDTSGLALATHRVVGLVA